MELICEPGRVWHDISAPQPSINIVLEQMGGRVEPRTPAHRAQNRRIEIQLQPNLSEPPQMDDLAK